MQEEQPQSESNWEYKPDKEARNYEGNDFAQATGVPMQEIPALKWSASEYVAHEKSAGWYSMFFAGSILIVFLVYLISRDILASVAVLLACSAISVYAARKPETNNYVLDEKGIKVQEKFYPYSVFRSFSIVEEGAINSIWLKPLKRLSSVVVMYFSPEDEQKIIDVLANFLPHEDRELDAIDRFSKRMRF
jgi:uncharacterized membrane protein YobD (UPF0266 family)